MSSPLPLLLGVLILTSYHKRTWAYPDHHDFPYPSGCARHPDASDRQRWIFSHQNLIEADTSIAMQLVMRTDGNVVTSLCPGSAYLLKVSFSVPGSSDPQDRRALLTSSLRSVSFSVNANDNKVRLEPLCPNRVYLAPHMPLRNPASSFSVPVNVGCDASGEVQMIVTSASCERPLCGLESALKQATLTAPVDWSCASSTCPSPPSPMLPPPQYPAPTDQQQPPTSLPPPDAPSTTPPPSEQQEPLQNPEPEYGQQPPISPAPTDQQVPLTYPSPADGQAPLSSAPSGQEAPLTYPAPADGQAPPLSPAPTDQQAPLTSTDQEPPPSAASTPPATPPSQPPPSPPIPAGRGGCQGSSLGYECSINIQGRMKLHWSRTDLPPVNPCTGSTEQGATSGMLHIAAEAQVDGYVSVGFPTTPGTMYPADVVLGWVKYDQPYIQVFDVTDHEMVDEGISAADSWARNMGVVRLTPTGGPSSTVICFSRALNDPRALHSSRLDPENLAYAWSVHDRPFLVEHDAGNYGSGILDLIIGSDEQIDVEDRAWLVTLHAAFMLVAWLFVVPLGSLMPQHRWIMASRPPLWFTMHVSFQIGGSLLTMGGLIIAFSKFPRAFDSAYDVTPYAEVWRSHAALGYIVIGLCGLQLILGFVRPRLGSEVRRYWGPLHSIVGRGSMLIAWATVGAGIATMYKMDRHADWRAWTITASILMGLNVIGGYVLSVLKPRAVPSTHSTEDSISMTQEDNSLDGKVELALLP